jgi:hypothetical protein
MRGGFMDATILAVISAAVEAYIESEEVEIQKRFGQKLNPWKMASRRETMTKRNLTVRGNPSRIRLRRFTLV